MNYHPPRILGNISDLLIDRRFEESIKMSSLQGDMNKFAMQIIMILPVKLNMRIQNIYSSIKPTPEPIMVGVLPPKMSAEIGKWLEDWPVGHQLSNYSV